jgi:hypothetical protein
LGLFLMSGKLTNQELALRCVIILR